MQILETPIRHASDYIVWYEGSGYSNAAHRPSVARQLDITLTAAPRDLKLIHKNRQTVLWRQLPPSLNTVVEGRASALQMQAPTVVPFTVSGEVSDPQKEFNPCRFNIMAGNANGHQIPIYRSPLGSAFSSAGGIYGCVQYDNSTIASWALVTVVVTPTIGAPISFVAQADINGDFVLPLSRLPTIKKDAPATTYSATIRIQADGSSGSDYASPSSYIPFNIESLDTENNFQASASFNVTPGEVSKISSANKATLILKEP